MNPLRRVLYCLHVICKCATIAKPLDTPRLDQMAARQITHDEWLERFRAKHGERFDYAKTQNITSSLQRITITCETHGDFEQVVYKHWSAQKHPCRACRLAANGKKHRKSVPTFLDEIKARFGDAYDVGNVRYEGYKKPVTLTCHEHGSFSQTPQLLRAGYGCPACGDAKSRIARACQIVPRKTANDFVQAARAQHGERFTYEKAVYLGAHTPIEITCATHGPFWQIPTNHLIGHGCPRCGTGGRISQAEDELFSFVKALCEDAVQSNRKLIAPFELDIFVPSRRLAIEVNGVYWHSDKRTESDAHASKRRACEAAGVRLLQFTDIELETRRETVERLVRNALGVAEGPKLNARDCAVVELPAATAKAFIEAWHMQGARAVSAHRFGLMHPREGLVAVMTFGTDVYRRNRTEQDLGTCDLTRFATKDAVRGAASKLFAHAQRTLGFQRCVSYSMSDWFDGGVYAKMGFVHDADVAPDYRVYHRYAGLLPKQQWQRKFIGARLQAIGRDDLLPFDAATDKRTERAMQDACGALRVYDSGKRRWVWNATNKVTNP